jgi:hypothetical protein
MGYEKKKTIHSQIYAELEAAWIQISIIIKVTAGKKTI